MPISDLLAQITGEAPSPQTLTNPPQKRKAESDLEHVNDKQVRTFPPSASLHGPVSQIARTTNLPNVLAKPLFRGVNGPTAIKANSPLPAMSIGSASSVMAEPAKPLKKGSYAEILARAKAAQSGPSAQIGKIQHKPIGKRLSKKERKEQEAHDVQAQRGSKKASRPNIKSNPKDRPSGARDSGKVLKKVDQIPEKKIKKAALATTGYKGTARPNRMIVKDKHTSTSVLHVNGRDQAGQSRKSGYASDEDDEDEREEEEEEEEEENYYSDESSDMEAAVFEVDEEEERAARIARKEDEDAAREEARLKREKEDKRLKLAAMARGKRR